MTAEGFTLIMVVTSWRSVVKLAVAGLKDKAMVSPAARDPREVDELKKR